MRNEARVHLWYKEKFGMPAKPFTSAAEAIDAFASTTCSVGIIRDDRGVRVYAPCGLTDVFEMHMRPHRRLAPKRSTKPRSSSTPGAGRRFRMSLGERIAQKLMSPASRPSRCP